MPSDYKFVPIPTYDGRTVYVTAGPAVIVPPNRELIRLAKDVKPAAPVAYDVSVADFQPFNFDKVVEVCPKIIHDALVGSRFHVGCRAGIGRTGTMLACLVAHSGYFTGDEAIAYVRQVYLAHAVETEEQERLIQEVAHAVREGTSPYSPPVPWNLQKAESLYEKLTGPTDPGNDAAFVPVREKRLGDATLLDWVVSRLV